MLGFHNTGLKGTAQDQHIVHPWDDEAHAGLQTSNVLNVYGAFRHGKTALMEKASGQFDSDRGQYIFLPFESPLVGNERQFSSHLHRFFRMKYRQHTDEELPNIDFMKDPMGAFLKVIDLYQEKLPELNKKGIRISLDEMQGPLLIYPDMRGSFSKLVGAIKDRPAVCLIVSTVYPLAACCDADSIGASIPSVRVRKWDKAASKKHFTNVACTVIRQRGGQLPKEKQLHLLFDRLWPLCGGSPNAYRMSWEEDIFFGETWRQLQGNPKTTTKTLKDCFAYCFRKTNQTNSLRSLMVTSKEEGDHTIQVLRQLAKGEVFKPQTALERAVALHLSISGWTVEGGDGTIKSAGHLYQDATIGNADNTEISNHLTLAKFIKKKQFANLICLEPLFKGNRFHLSSPLP